MADWEEIKRLAADFQKVQLTSTSQKFVEIAPFKNFFIYFFLDYRNVIALKL